MLNVQKYLKEFGVENLKKEFGIKVREYDDRIVLNYDQIESVKFHPIVDECRNLILSKEFEVISQSFQRFYNYLEGVQTSQNEIPLKFRIASDDVEIKDFSINEAEFYNKVDGSLINFYNYKNQWNVSTRSTAFGEGESNMGRTFAEVFKSAKEFKNLNKIVTESDEFNDLTMIFELTSPETRVVVPFSETRIFLIGARDRKTGNELKSFELDILSKKIGVERPERYKFSNIDELVKWVNNQNWMTEGIVLVIDCENGSHSRIKVKNATHLAIAHMRNNGKLSLKSVVKVILTNEQEEYLSYFAMDKWAFDFVEQELNIVKEDLNNVWNQCKDVENQKEFALKMMPMVKYKFETGILFSAKKTKEDPIKLLIKSEPEKLVEGLGLKEKFAKTFNKNDEED